MMIGDQTPSSSTMCRLSAPHDLPLDALLFKQFVKLLKGKLGKRSGYLLIIHSSFLLLWSMERMDKVLCS